MNIIRRSGLSVGAFESPADRLPSHTSRPSRHDESPSRRFGLYGECSEGRERGEHVFSLMSEPAARVTGPADVLRWLRVWHARQNASWDGGSMLRVIVHGGALDTLVVEARRGLQGITVSLLCVQLAMYRRLLAHRGQLSRTLTSRLALPVTIEVEARYARDARDAP
ncbi:hypothetical protein PCA31118_04869 [Pandoraea captiosa]|uniref:Uncharacterized protein n=1 Tax=Pandoraea captiosa TaxID=2508302 RepID=A0A5E5AQY5_9BURK|nr:hypothetical protein [Pandoraea captiosa]VVE74933.1 hypothetical protein PCA31118_04869 [Pandoraea captiosa]